MADRETEYAGMHKPGHPTFVSRKSEAHDPDFTRGFREKVKIVSISCNRRSPVAWKKA
jgi:hypothetical protein